MIDTIVDVYHQNTVDLAALKQGGIVAVIHKATEGASFRDAEYRARRELAKQLGLLWGAYHYSSGASITDQVSNFLEHAQPDDHDFVALDWEASTNGPDMTLDQVRRFAHMIRTELGRWPVIYGGRLLRETIGATNDTVLAKCPLWYSRYAGSPIGIPTNTWPTYTLWQFTDGSSGPEPHYTPGAGRCDRNRFQGTRAQLEQQWPFSRREEGAGIGAGVRETTPTIANSGVKRPRNRRKKRIES